MSATAFTDVPAWPGEESGQQLESGRDARLDNQPPLEERVLMEFVEQLDKEGLTARIAELTASAGRVPASIDDDCTAGKVGDLIRQASAARKRIEELREVHNRPLLNAQRSLKGRMDGMLADLDTAIRGVRGRLDAYVAEQERKRREAQRIADEQARAAREAAETAAREAEAAGKPAPAVSPPTIIPAEIEKPIVRGDQGAAISTRTVWKSEVEDYKKAFAHVATNANVREAIDKAVAALVRAGTRELKGVRIFEETASAVR